MNINGSFVYNKIPQGASAYPDTLKLKTPGLTTTHKQYFKYLSNHYL